MQKRARTTKSRDLWDRKKRQTREELLGVAHRLFTENESSDVTVGQIAELANVSQKTFFKYFQNNSQFSKEYLLDWLKGIVFWSVEESPVENCRSSIVPTDVADTLDWIVDNRRILKMAMVHTDFLYTLDKESLRFDPELQAAIRRPMLERVMRGQLRGLFRRDISADEVCNTYDVLRIDTVRRWLYLQDAEATRESLHARFATFTACLISGLRALN